MECRICGKTLEPRIESYNVGENAPSEVRMAVGIGTHSYTAGYCDAHHMWILRKSGERYKHWPPMNFYVCWGCLQKKEFASNLRTVLGGFAEWYIQESGHAALPEYWNPVKSEMETKG